MRRSLFVLLAISGLLLASCGPAVMPAASPQTDSGEVFVVALPRIVITFDANGKPGLEGVALEDIARSLGANLDLGMYRIDPFYTNWMTAANIQHVELRQTGDGIALLVNGALMPSLAFKNGSLEQVGNVAPLLGAQGAAVADLLQKFGPLVQRLGLSVVLKFPVAEGAPVLDYGPADIKVSNVAAAAPAPASAVVKFEVRYDDQGVPSILGISAWDLAAMGLNAPLALDPSYLGGIQANNIQNVQLSARPDGLYLWVNGTQLPNLSWDAATLTNAVDVYAQMNPGVAPQYLSLIRTLVPWLGAMDMSVLVHFPVAPGVAEIAAKMQ